MAQDKNRAEALCTELVRKTKPLLASSVYTHNFEALPAEKPVVTHEKCYVNIARQGETRNIYRSSTSFRNIGTKYGDNLTYKSKFVSEYKAIYDI